MTNLLDGIRVIDWTQAHHGAATGYMLGDLKADVIKIEEPAGDIARFWGSITTAFWWNSWAHRRRRRRSGWKPVLSFRLNN